MGGRAKDREGEGDREGEEMGGRAKDREGEGDGRLGGRAFQQFVL